MTSSVYSHSALQKLIDAYGISLKKRWGQNFLIDRNTAIKIVNALPQDEDAVVWEIGPGFGALTELLVARYKKVVLFELDRALISYLQRRWQQLVVLQPSSDDDAVRIVPGKHITLVSGNALHTLPAALKRNPSPDIVVGNLPYRIAAHILLCCIRSATAPPRTITSTVQQEIAMRLAASPGKNYSSFSVLMQLAYRVRKSWTVPRTVFYPAPHVESSCVTLVRSNTDGLFRTPTPAQVELIEPLLRAAFHSRRATLHKNIDRSARYRVAYRRVWHYIQQYPDRISWGGGDIGVAFSSMSVSDRQTAWKELTCKRAEELFPQHFAWLAELLTRMEYEQA